MNTIKFAAQESRLWANAKLKKVIRLRSRAEEMILPIVSVQKAGSNVFGFYIKWRNLGDGKGHQARF